MRPCEEREANRATGTATLIAAAVTPARGACRLLPGLRGGRGRLAGRRGVDSRDSEAGKVPVTREVLNDA
eukprot:943387-Pleurochrysis_carterae.AAC.1